MKRGSRAWLAGCLLALVLSSARDAEAARFYPSDVWEGANGLYMFRTYYRGVQGDPVSVLDACFQVVGDLGTNPRFDLYWWQDVANPSCAYGPINMAFVTTYGVGTHNLTIIATQRVTGAELARVSFTVYVYPPPPPRTLRLRAAVEGDAPGPSAGVTLPAQAHVPLGAMVRFEAIDNNGQPVGANFALGTPTVDPGVAANALFRDYVLLAYGTSGAFQAVHKGRLTIVVTPVDAAVAPGTITVIVEDPQALGTVFNELDPLFYAVGHQLGIPPHFIKAHAHKESRFNRFAYRYEPIGASVGDLTAVSRDENLRTKAPYADYRLATARDSLNDALPDGARLTPADRDVRAGLLIGCDASGQNGRPIRPTDAQVSAWEIFRCNNARINWAREAGAAAAARVGQLESDPFTAQTGLAASYGLLQMTYVTAIQDMRWQGDQDGAKNPSLLLDTPANAARGGGSLGAGTAKLTRDFRRIDLDVAQGLRPPVSEAELLVLFIKAWDLYNSGETGYGVSVLDSVPLYSPIAKTSVFGGG